MVEWLRLSLRAWDYSGEPVASAAFFDRLLINEEDPVTLVEGPGTPRVELAMVDTNDLPESDDPAGSFAGALWDALLGAASWLDNQPLEIFEELRAAGRTTDIFIAGWIEDDQLDLSLPPEFLLACGRLGLTVTICTNA